MIITHRSSYLETHLHSEDPGEDVIEVVENLIAVGVLRNGVLRCQGDTAGRNHNHDEQVEVPQVHHKMTETTNSEKIK